VGTFLFILRLVVVLAANSTWAIRTVTTWFCLSRHNTLKRFTFRQGTSFTYSLNYRFIYFIHEVINVFLDFLHGHFCTSLDISVVNISYRTPVISYRTPISKRTRPQMWLAAASVQANLKESRSRTYKDTRGSPVWETYNRAAASVYNIH